MDSPKVLPCPSNTIGSALQASTALCALIKNDHGASDEIIRIAEDARLLSDILGALQAWLDIEASSGRPRELPNRGLQYRRSTDTLSTFDELPPPYALSDVFVF
jgi:hypothetical protein